LFHERALAARPFSNERAPFLAVFVDWIAAAGMGRLQTSFCQTCDFAYSLQLASNDMIENPTLLHTHGGIKHLSVHVGCLGQAQDGRHKHWIG
jgi:hypothetical protein